MPDLDDCFLRTDYDTDGDTVWEGRGKFSRRALIDDACRRTDNRFVKTKSVIGDPALDDIVAWIVWESVSGKAVPYIAVFKKKE